MESYKKHSRRQGIAKYDDFKMYEEDKRNVEGGLDLSTNLSSAVSPIDPVLFKELNKIIQQIKELFEEQTEKYMQKNKNLREIVLAKVKPFKKPRPNPEKKLSGNFKVTFKVPKSENKTQRSEEKNKKSKIEAKNKKIGKIIRKTGKVKSMNIPAIELKANKKAFSSISFKTNFLV